VLLGIGIGLVAIAIGLGANMLWPGSDRIEVRVAFTTRPLWVNVVGSLCIAVIFGWLALVNWKVGRWR
jgi:ABC-type antimicrobial peptide transport system permease subunit